MTDILQTAMLLRFSFSAPLWTKSEGQRITLSSWTWPPYIFIPLLLTAVLYATGIIKLTRRSDHSRPHLFHILSFTAGWLSLIVALDSPIHELSEQLFWVHMTQHEILMLVAAPLIVLGAPLHPMLWALPRSTRALAGTVARNSVFKTGWLAVSGPFAAWLLHGLILWLWHAPILFDLAVEHEPIHAIQHISFFGSALLFWWALVQGRKARLGYGKGVLYIFSTGVHMGLLGALLTFSPQPWYAPYVATDAAWNISALADQQLGALIMWVPAGAVLLVIGLVFFWKWLEESDRRWELTRTAALLRSSQVDDES
jgi:putative membrane protein